MIGLAPSSNTTSTFLHQLVAQRVISKKQFSIYVTNKMEPAITKEGVNGTRIPVSSRIMLGGWDTSNYA